LGVSSIGGELGFGERFGDPHTGDYTGWGWGFDG
jgi:hypothetical protein